MHKFCANNQFCTYQYEQYFNFIFFRSKNKKANGYYPVKLRVYNPVNKKARLLSLSKVIYDDKDKYLIQFTLKNGFPNQRSLDSILYAERPREDTKRLKLFFIGLEKKASEIAENLSPFSFEEFENKMHLQVGQTETKHNPYTQFLEGKQSLGLNYHIYGT